jgi:hypothetical protein
VGLVLLVVAVGFVVVALARNFSQVRDSLGLLSATDLVASAAAGAGAMLLTGLSWRIVLAGLGSRLPLRPAMALYCAAQLGKYVPGSVWVVALQAELGRRHGISRAVMAMSYAVSLLVAVATGGLVGLLSLLAVGGQSVRAVAPVAAVVGVLAAAVMIRPRAANAAIGWFAGKVGRPLPSLDLPGGALAAALATTTAAWLLFGLHAWALARPLGATPALIAVITGAFALAFVAGLLLVPLPSGAGVREGVLVALLSGSIGTPAALAVGVVSRFLLVVVDLALAAALGTGRWQARLSGDRGHG